MTLEQSIDAGASILWVGAHPDDETIPGPMLARACASLGNDCLLVVLTPGQAGTCFAPPCLPDVETVRRAEMEEAARRYGAELELYDFTNGEDPAAPVEEVRGRWEAEGDPLGVLVEAIRRFRPNVVLSLDPSKGFTGHTEHQVASRLVEEATPLAADPSYAGSGAAPHRADRLYQVLNRYWFLLPFIGWDEGPVEERFPLHAPCPGTDLTCFDIGLAAAEAHESQWPFILAMRVAGPLVEDGLLDRVDF